MDFLMHFLALRDFPQYQSVSSAPHQGIPPLRKPQKDSKSNKAVYVCFGPQWPNRLSQIYFAHQQYSNTFSFRTGRTGSKGLWDWVIGVSKSRSQVDLTGGHQA